ncbi:LysM domain-containing protein [Histoplasma capsulatum var. duboisii H88]|uniref:LysM domain-containing protein n=1 Tax=Ajellomyces capsulatus (strain H88) TaxID=544711 RepID=F0UQW3_AJEC8|nr:LysM domain-containing protein [Histoplasma capsulatum var. duboisii H88]
MSPPSKCFETILISEYPQSKDHSRPAIPNPPYMVDNQHNYFNTAPDKGEQNGPVWLESGSLEAYMSQHLKQLNRTAVDVSKNLNKVAGSAPNTTADSSYWLPKLAHLGVQPLAGADYKFYRDVVEYGADNTGEKDATEAINAAIGDGDRCGLECGNTFTKGAIIYFPPGTYKICRPIIQLYYTQFIGDALDPPIIKGCDTFQGIALFDTDPYVPNGNGQNWYINQNQFFRQIRNFIFDLTEMPLSTADHDQPLVPTGIHWQVSQACSLQNLVFNMPKATDSNKVTHVGIFMENGSGGFVSDLVFNGGNIGWRAGSQQYTAMNLKFNDCLTAVQMIWDWGFNWQRIEVDGGAIAFNISGRGGDTGQGVGSVSIIVKSENGDVILDGTNHVGLWAMGRRYDGYNGTYILGEVDAPKKGKRLLDEDGKLFYRPRPQYKDLKVDEFLIATEHDCKNDGTGDNTGDINAFLEKAKKEHKIAYFPAGVYRVGGTVFIPTGSRVQGASWSQIQGAGFYFNDIHNPRVVVQVGEKGDVGDMEIVDMMFTAQGATAGAILVEWNVHEDSQGSAAMWDSHIRVGGASGTDLDIQTCPKFEFSDACICASLLFHITPQASGYFENIWIWLADHDNDKSVYDSPDKIANQISLYAARGTLIESEGPSWFYGTGSEHTVMYQYQVYGAKDIYLGHIQTETPYYQPVPIAPLPFSFTKEFPGDPSFEKCKITGCSAAWGLRIINSESITLHSSGLYSFFQEYYQDCVPTHNCQERILEVKGSKDVVLFNTFTVGIVEIGTGINHGAIFQNDSNQSGFTTEVSIWIPLEGDDEYDIVYVGPEVYNKPSLTCPADCILVFPTSLLSSKTTIDPGKYTTTVEYGHRSTTTISGREVPTFYTTVTTITLTIDPITTDGMPYSNINITEGQTSTSLTVLPSVDIPPIPVPIPDGEGKTTTRNITVPPWPAITRGPPESWSNPDASSTDGMKEGVYHTPFVTSVVATKPTVSTLSFPSTTTTQSLPVWSTWPPRVVTPIEEEVKKPEPGKTSCKLWFFSFCLNGENKGLRWNLPPGIYPPGPPPPGAIDPPPSWTIKPPLPPWPPITVGRDNILTYPKEEPTKCEKKSAEICMTTVFKTTTTRGTITSTASSISSTCDTIRGCSASDWDTTTTQTKPDHCPSPTTNPVKGTASVIPPPGCPANAIVYLSNMKDVGQIPQILAKYKGKYVEVKSNELQQVAFIWVPLLDQETMNALLESTLITTKADRRTKRDNNPSEPIFPYKQGNINHSTSNRAVLDEHNTNQSAQSTSKTRSNPYIWDLSQISTPKNAVWNLPDGSTVDGNGFKFNFDETSGRGQHIYMLEDGFYPNHPEFRGMDIEVLTPDRESQPWAPEVILRPNYLHGAQVGSKIVGANLGLCDNCKLHVSPIFLSDELWVERLIEQLMVIQNHVSRNGFQHKAIINMSFGIGSHVRHASVRRFYELLTTLDTWGVSMVCSAGNNAVTISGIIQYPALFANPSNPFYIKNTIVVGATDPDGNQGFFTTALVSSLIGYYKSIQSPWKDQLRDPANVKKMIKIFHRRIEVDGKQFEWTGAKPIIWNGQMSTRSCLADYDTIDEWDLSKRCPRIKANLAEEANEGETLEPCQPGTGNPLKQLDGSYCPRMPGAGSHTVSFTSKAGVKPTPTCASGTGCGGHLCTGFFCSPMPTGVPPDRHDPKDPNASSRVPTTTGPGDPEPTCNDKCKLDKGNPCKCNENGCDSESPGCCGNASCPMCVCGGNSCSPSSPACCKTETCQWSWTGGGGGDGSGKPPGPRIGSLLFALDETYSSHPGGDVLTRFWKVFVSELDREADVCNDTPLKLVDASSDPENRPHYPPSMEFTVGPGHMCKYTEDSNGAGILKCDGSKHSPCKARGLDDKKTCLVPLPGSTPSTYYLAVDCKF